MKIDKKIKTIIALIVIFSLISIFLIIGLKITIKNDKNTIINTDTIDNINLNNESSNQNDEYEITDSIGYDPGSERFNVDKNKLQSVTGKISYFTAKNIAMNYINAIGNSNSYFLMELISPQYISNNGITTDNIMNMFQDIPKKEANQNYNIIITEILTTPVDGLTEIYLIDLKVELLETNQIFDMKLIIGMNIEKNVYYVYPEQFLNNNGMNNLKIGDNINFDPSEIEKSGNNFIYEMQVNDTDIANEYFYNYCNLLKNYKEEAYNKLDNNYANKRFVNREGFNKYLEENQFLLNMIKIDSYMVNKHDNYIEYICKDQYDNYYTFREEDGIMNYIAFLDSYSVELDCLNDMYNKANSNTKVSHQINKFKQMLNFKDYNSIYNKLNTVFKNNNFGSISNLEQYLKNNIYDINQIEVQNIQQNDDYYICTCRLINLNNKEESKKINIILKLIDSSNFEMSFSFE